jgi:hypothetical protein
LCSLFYQENWSLVTNILQMLPKMETKHQLG